MLPLVALTAFWTTLASSFAERAPSSLSTIIPEALLPLAALIVFLTTLASLSAERHGLVGLKSAVKTAYAALLSTSERGRSGSLDVLADLDQLRRDIEHYRGDLYGDRPRRVIEAAWRYLNIRSQEGGG